MTWGCRVMLETGAMSRMKLKLSFLIERALIAFVVPTRSSV